MLTKRKVIFGTYDTAVDGLWTLAACRLEDAEPIETLVDLPGRLDGPIDFTEALTGDVQYGQRPLTVRLESSEGTRLERRAIIEKMINQLHGRRCKIWLPDDPGHYVTGRLKIKEEYNDLAHAAVIVTASCAPWRYENDETIISVELSAEARDVTLTNNRRTVYPMLTVEGEATLVDGGSTYQLSAGTYTLAGLKLAAGEERTLRVSGTGSVTFAYRKAVL